MKVCFCVHRVPYPPVAGGRRETYKLIEGLTAAGHDVDLVVYADDSEKADAMGDAAGCSVTHVPGTPDRTPANLLRNVVSRDPLPVMKARRDAYREEVARRCKDADVLHLHALQTCHLAENPPEDIPTVSRLNNVKYEIYRQFANHTRNPAKAAYAYFQYFKTKRYERTIPSFSALTLTITPEDKAMLVEEGATGRIEVLPAGVDTEEFKPSGGGPDEGVVTFFGSMDYHPNEEAAVWFATEVFPTLRDRVGNVTFEIVGKDPGRAVQQLAEQPGVHVTGFVEDIQEYINRATVIVLPIRVGTGIRMKSLHAMAMAKPIVSTPVGMQGIQIESGRGVSIADTAPAFAEAVAALLDDPDRRTEYGRKARAFVQDHHAWPGIVEQLESHYASVQNG